MLWDCVWIDRLKPQGTSHSLLLLRNISPPSQPEKNTKIGKKRKKKKIGCQLKSIESDITIKTSSFKMYSVWYVVAESLKNKDVFFHPTSQLLIIMCVVMFRCSMFDECIGWIKMNHMSVWYDRCYCCNEKCIVLHSCI